MTDWSNKQEVLALVKINGMSIIYASPELKGDFDVVLAAVKQDGFAIQEASPELKKNETIVLAAIQNNDEALKFVPIELKNDKDFMIKVIKENPKTIQYIEDNLKNDEKFILAILDDSIVSKFEGVTFKAFNKNTFEYDKFNYKELIIKFTNYIVIIESNEIRKGVKQLQNASSGFKNNKDFMLEMIEKDLKNIQYIGDNNPLRNDKEFMLKMTEKDPKNIQYIESDLRNDKEFIMKIFEIANSKEKLEISVIELIANIYNEKKDIPGWNKIIEFCEKHFLKYVIFANKILDNSLKKGDYFAMWEDKSPKEPQGAEYDTGSGIGNITAFQNAWISNFIRKFKWETNNNPLDYLSKNIQTIMVHLYNENAELKKKIKEMEENIKSNFVSKSNLTDELDNLKNEFTDSLNDEMTNMLLNNYSYQYLNNDDEVLEVDIKSVVDGYIDEKNNA